MPNPNTTTLLVSMARPNGQDQGEDILARLDTMIALLTEIRDDQRATQGELTSGKVLKTTTIAGSLLG